MSERVILKKYLRSIRAIMIRMIVFINPLRVFINIIILFMVVVANIVVDQGMLLDPQLEL
jgi:hypothetical protein